MFLIQLGLNIDYLRCNTIFTYHFATYFKLQNNSHDINTALLGSKHTTKKTSALSSASSTSAPVASPQKNSMTMLISPGASSSVLPSSSTKLRTRGRRTVCKT